MQAFSETTEILCRLPTFISGHGTYQDVAPRTLFKFAHLLTFYFGTGARGICPVALGRERAWLSCMTIDFEADMIEEMLARLTLLRRQMLPAPT